MISHLPAMALWILAGFFVYKVAVIGSIFGIIRFITSHLFDWLKLIITTRRYKQIENILEGMCTDGQVERLLAEIYRLRGKGVGIRSNYIHSKSVDWLREAIDMKIESEMKQKESYKALFNQTGHQRPDNDPNECI